MSSQKTGTLYLIPTALSKANKDFYFPKYNIELIGEINYFLVENIRTARRFIKFIDASINISSLNFFELDKHNPSQDISSYMKMLLDGEDIGLLSEAGCPAVADPGSKAVSWAHKNNIKVKPLIGPSSILLALMASGFNGQTFKFNGYLPIDSKEREKELKRLERDIELKNETQIFIETPYRNIKLMEDIIKYLHSSIQLCVAVNLTDPEKESIITQPLSWWKSKTLTKYHKEPAIFLLYK